MRCKRNQKSHEYMHVKGGGCRHKHALSRTANIVILRMTETVDHLPAQEPHPHLGNLPGACAIAARMLFILKKGCERV
jgi:hypothetical protein